jgi:hypothetical protein
MVSLAIVTADAMDFAVDKSKALPQRSLRGAEGAEKPTEENGRFRSWEIKTFTAKIAKARKGR